MVESVVDTLHSTSDMPAKNLSLNHDRLADLCRRWKVRELSLFGSTVRGDSRPDSDVDLLVTFDADESWNLWDLGEMASELVELFGREVDLVEERSLTNPFRRKSILRDKQIIYAAQ